MYVDDYEQFIITGLKEKVLDVAEKDICNSVSTAGYTWMMQGCNLPIFCEPIGDWYRRPFW
jgi:hypothetical protein